MVVLAGLASLILASVATTVLATDLLLEVWFVTFMFIGRIVGDRVLCAQAPHATPAIHLHPFQ